MACPPCNKDTPSERLLSKTTYVGHRRFLKKKHKWRRSLEFNGKTNDGDPLRKFTQEDILTQIDRLPTREKGKHSSYGGVKIKRNPVVELNWTKRSIFYELDFLGTLLMNDKSKDTTKARQDLKTLDLRKELWLSENQNDEFGSNFKQKVTDNDSNIMGMKSHDCHIMMQQLLPYELCGNCRRCTNVSFGDEFIRNPDPISYDETTDFSYPPPQPQTYSYELCGNDHHYGFDCLSHFPLVYEPEPCNNQNYSDNCYPQNSQSYPQQYLCCENCRGPRETFQCQPLNQNFYEPNLCYNSIASGFDQFQPPQFPVIHQPPQEMSIQDMEDLKQQYLDKMKSLINEFPIKDYRDEKIDIKINELKENFNGMSIEINKKKKLQQLEQVANLSTYPSRLFNSFCYEDDDDDDKEYTIAITPVLPTEEPDNSLSMGDEHLSTILETESDELIKSSVENLVPIPRESEDFSDIKSECDVPVCDDFTTFSNLLFDADVEFFSSDDESFSDEDVPKEIYSNPLFDKEIISTKIDPHHFDAESDLIESMLNQDTSIIYSPKIDSLLEEFSGELAHIDLILGINETDFDPEEEIRLVEKLLYDNSSPRPPEEFNSKNSDAIIDSFSPSPILVKDSNSLMEEIDLFLTPDDSMPPGIENDDYDSEGDILFLEELLSNDSPPLPVNESFHFDVSSSPRPPAKPSDDDEIEPDTGVLTAKVVGDISKLYVHVLNILPTLTNLSPMFYTLLPFSSENDDKIFNPGILASNEEKSPHLLSHRGFNPSKIISDFSESPMMISGGDIPILDVSFLHFNPP
ncbi:hypothetical protein Tco_1237407 [Tanacetum coccineum]